MQKGTFLIDIGAKINKQRDENGKHVLSVVEDKVVQDIDGTEGTGVNPFAGLEGTSKPLILTGLVLHGSCPPARPCTHYFRCSQRPYRVRFPKRPKTCQRNLWRQLPHRKMDWIR